jgi:hypothetical protein
VGIGGPTTPHFLCPLTFRSVHLTFRHAYLSTDYDQHQLQIRPNDEDGRPDAHEKRPQAEEVALELGLRPQFAVVLASGSSQALFTGWTTGRSRLEVYQAPAGPRELVVG